MGNPQCRYQTDSVGEDDSKMGVSIIQSLHCGSFGGELSALRIHDLWLMNYREALPKSHRGRVDPLEEPRWVGQAGMRTEGAYSFNYTVRLVIES
jgi:hypothetical protein